MTRDSVSSLMLLFSPSSPEDIISLTIKDICGAFEYIANLQNQFLYKTLELAASGCRSLLYLQDENKGAGIRPVSLQEISDESSIHSLFFLGL